MSVVDESGRPFNVNLTNCDREPIHVPGHIQPFGSLLALNPANYVIEQASLNAEARFGIPAEKLIGMAVQDVLGEDIMAALREIVGREEIEGNPVQFYLGELAGTGPCRYIVHSFREMLIIEAEDALPNEDQVDFPALIKKTLVKLEKTESLDEFCDVLATEFRAISGWDRVMIYRFLEDASGTVVGESLTPGMDSFFGLHYPASDIPAQARELFKLNATRLIVDPSYEIVPLIPQLNARTNLPLNMSFATSRGVSPIHCEYLRNMGVGASMSQALVVDGELWGLIASHHCTPTLVPYNVRVACEFLAKSAALMIRGKTSVEQSSYRERAREQYEHLVFAMAKRPSVIDGLTDIDTPLENYVNANGCAIFTDGECYLSGKTPDITSVKRIVAWLKAEYADDVFVTDNLARFYSGAEQIKDTASGLLAIRVTNVPGEYVMWFRSEKPTTVQWAGNPEKPVAPGPFGDRLSPRKSFEAWQQEVRLKSEPWQESEIEAARYLRLAIVEVVIRRAEEVSRTNLRLERSNVELDSFAYIASHDLKEPLRGIHNYANFLLEDYGEILERPGQERLQALVRLAERMETLTDSLLHYSRLGRQDLELREVDLNRVLGEAIESTHARLLETGTEVRIPWPLPTARCDAVQLSEVFQNLIANAAKYNNKKERWVEIGFQRGGTLPSEQPFVMYVKDNGIGILPKHFDTIFRIFKRLHGRNDFGGGSGAGLTIAQKIIQRHGGRLWLESVPDEGTTFYFTLGA